MAFDIEQFRTRFHGLMASVRARLGELDRVGGELHRRVGELRIR